VQHPHRHPEGLGAPEGVQHAALGLDGEVPGLRDHDLVAVERAPLQEALDRFGVLAELHRFTYFPRLSQAASDSDG